MTTPANQSVWDGQSESDALYSRISRILVALLLASLAVWGGIMASKSMAFGGITGDGQLLDGAGDPTDGPILRVTMLLRPSAMFFVLAVIVVLIGVLIARRQVSFARADAMLRRTVAGLVVLAVVAVSSSYLAFAFTPLREDMTNGERIVVPFGYIDVTVEDVSETAFG